MKSKKRLRTLVEKVGDAAEMDKAKLVARVALTGNYREAEIVNVSDESPHLPVLLKSAVLVTILGPGPRVIALLECDELDAEFGVRLIELGGVVGVIPNELLGEVLGIEMAANRATSQAKLRQHTRQEEN